MRRSKYFFIVAGALFAANCQAQDIKPSSDKTKAIETKTVGNKTIIGTWGWTNSGNNCTEIWRFFEDGTSIVLSDREVTLGTYSISSSPNEAGRYVLTENVLVDHGGKNCGGNAKNSVGDTYTNYIKFHETGDAYRAMFHPTDDNGFGPLFRISK